MEKFIFCAVCALTEFLVIQERHSSVTSTYFQIHFSTALANTMVIGQIQQSKKIKYDEILKNRKI